MIFAQMLAISWTMGEAIARVPYHIPIIRVQLTRSLMCLFDDTVDEVRSAFEDLVPVNQDGQLVITIPGSLAQTTSLRQSGWPFPHTILS